MNHPELVPDFAARLANALGLPFFSCIEKVRNNRQQKYMENSYQQVSNLDGAFCVNLQPQEYQPCLLVDDIIDSGWTVTVALSQLDRPKTINELVETLDVNNSQLKCWLQQAVAEKKIEKKTKPVRYGRLQSHQPCFFEVS